MIKLISAPSLLLVTLSSIAQMAIASPLAYVPNEKDGNVSVIDTQSDKVLYNLPAKGKLGNKIQAVAMDPAGQKLYVVVRDDNAVAV